jgi:hypothetical protein
MLIKGYFWHKNYYLCYQKVCMHSTSYILNVISSKLSCLLIIISGFAYRFGSLIGLCFQRNCCPFWPQQKEYVGRGGAEIVVFVSEGTFQC